MDSETKQEEIPSFKECKRCKGVFDLSKFYKRKWKKKVGYAEGHDPWCVECRLQYHKENYTSKLQTGDPWKLAGEILNRMKDRTKKKGYEEDVEWTTEDIYKEITKGTCCKTGVPFVLGTTGTNRYKNPFNPSPDRIDNSKGYTKDNVQWVVFIYNTMRSNFKHEDVEMFINHIRGTDVLESRA